MTEQDQSQPVAAVEPEAGAMPAAGTPSAAPAPIAPAGAPPAGPPVPPYAGRPAGGPRRKREFRGKYVPRRKVCAFCADKTAALDYKDAARLRRFVSDRGKIEPRRKTGTCAKHQRTLSTALKRARFIALLPYTAEHARLMGGPPLGRS